MTDTNTWVTSDIHFDHKSILTYCPESRPYRDVEEMNEAIITKWNDKVHPHDNVWVVGDITFGRPLNAMILLNRLHGMKHLVVGNHDSNMLKHKEFTSCFNSIQDYKELKHNGTLVVMMHYPIAFWNKAHYSSVMLHGHLHGNPSGLRGRIKDIGMDTNNLYPYLLDDVIEELKNIESLAHH